MTSRRPWLIFAVGVFAYLVAVTQRSTIGVAGTVAAERFHVSAAALSTLAVAQLAVYAALQVPVGVAIDRFGPRVMMAAGSAVMIAGQVTVALSGTLGLAVVGRMLVGAGDAAIFIALIRLLNSWFTGRTVPILTQWTGNIGQLGQVLSAVPFAAILHLSGWTSAFLSAASLSAIALIGILVVVVDHPPASAEPPRPASLRQSVASLAASLRRPGTQLGFWSHYVTQSTGTVFTLLWGIPFLVFGLGYAPQVASGLLVVVVASGIVAGPVLGILTARFPFRRSNLVLGIVAALAVVWTLVLAWPGGPPTAVVVVFLIVLGVGGPGSVIGFDFARSFNPLSSLGSANGVVNVGGFSASFLMMFLVGALLDAHHAAAGGALYSLEGFRTAFLVQYPVVGLGVAMLLHARRRTRRRMAADEGIEVGPIWVAVARAWRRSHAA